ncbi:hypothetical protein PHA77_01680 [Edwardsiella tarda]|uniref:hypothetical protein n=1 Tax=Edwardsiella tarda TaxID=636 RepID=UPI002443D4C0|nr:hypothetical protein [Edwardsiella tarda]WGE29406.1 hypothetical protein PHA77_01680 [Edwardsiella tarda]
MRTITITPSNAWQLACDGNKNMLLQLVSGAAGFCISDTQPAADAPFHPMPAGVLIPVTKPTKIWVRSTRHFKHDTEIMASETE